MEGEGVESKDRGVLLGLELALLLEPLDLVLHFHLPMQGASQLPSRLSLIWVGVRPVHGLST